MVKQRSRWRAGATRMVESLLRAYRTSLGRLAGLRAPEAADVFAGPIRGELYGAEHLRERARELASTQHVALGAAPKQAPLLKRLVETARILERVFHLLESRSAERQSVGPAGDWLLDNDHVLREHLDEVHASLPSNYYRELPTLDAGPLAGYPRIYEVAITLISHSEGRLDHDNISAFVTAFQEVQELTLGELWAIPAMLRIGSLENVRRMALRTSRRLEDIARADEAAHRISRAAETGGIALERELAQFTGTVRELSDTFVSRFLHQLRVEGGTLPAVVRLRHWISEEALSAEEATARATQRLAITQVVMANSITSLRAVGRLDWPTLVEALSGVDAVLRDDPLGYYARMTFDTRDRYRHVVERIARRTSRVESEVARLVVKCATDSLRQQGHNGHDERRDHVGYYLLDAGRVELELLTSYRPTLSERIYRWTRRHPSLVFMVGVSTTLAFALAALLWLGGNALQSQWLIVLLLGLVPATELAVSVVNTIVTELEPPRSLPRLDLVTHGVPSEYRTAVVIPTLLPDVDAAREAIDNMEVQFLASREANVHFALLSDFTDAPTAHAASDAAIIEAAVSGVRALNARYAQTSGNTFFLFHRARQWNPQEGVWMGWERKRGKLGEFNRFVLSGEAAGFSVIEGSSDVLRHVRYVITLDADTVLPPDAAPALIGAIAHPLNRAEYDPERGRVVRGHGILQPRVGVSLPSALGSAFAAIYSGHPGVDPYTTAVSDVYQDLFGEGSFTGKGIYDVEVFERATHGRFPENTLLSHDLIEGNYARAGLATDVIVYDDYPGYYLAFSQRKHRWIRGDWQLLSWLRGTVPGPNGPERNRLSWLSRWKIFDNLRRSVVELSQFAFFVVGWLLLPVPVLRWTLLGLGVIAAPWIVSAILAVVRPPSDRAWPPYYRMVWRESRDSAWQVLLAVSFLPHLALLSLDAIVRTLWRVLVSHRHMLEWKTARASELSASVSGAVHWRSMWLSVSVAALVAALLLVSSVSGASQWLGRTPQGLLALVTTPIFALWLCAPAIAHALSTPRARRARVLSTVEREQALMYAARHWNFFETFATAETEWLAPDNFQATPAPIVAMRTSPTNIGLQLLSVASACDLSFITVEEMIERLERIVVTLRRLPKLHGHYFNWYDLRDLSVLEPAYISTVDSGNLGGHLIALQQACLTRADDESCTRSQRQRLLALAAWAHADAMAMDFAVLFDRRWKLFSIGLQQHSGTLDASHYDLLASEARLASYFAIAKKDVPADHWFRLGRSVTYAHGAPALVSWSGSMFEYLMPLLVMKSHPSTVLEQTYSGMLERQMAYGEARDAPWGISESAYNVRDREATYQYRTFGVPDLALKRGLARDLVVAPYATVLAAMVDPRAAFANLSKLQSLGLLGEYGFIDAADFTRPEVGERFARVDTFMAHHIGMSLVALTNCLLNNVWQERFHGDALVRAAELLLHERAPREVVHREPQHWLPEEGQPNAELDGPVVRAFPTAETATPHVAFLGHAPYTVMVTNAGSGYSRYGALAVNRWKADGTADATGQFCYIKDLGSGEVWSAAHQPTCTPAASYRAALGTEQVTFDRRDGEISSCTQIAVVPEDSAEVRRVTITNHGRSTRDLELTSYGEIVLAPADADRAHPAFGNLFVETAWHAWCNAITATRRPRSATEERQWLVHLVDSGTERVGEITCETDRARFLGRGRSTRDPLALELDGSLSGTTGGVLDPIFAIRTRVRVMPGQSASVAFTTLVATSEEQAFALADRYRDSHAAQRAIHLAWTSSRVELRELGVSVADAALFQELAGHLLYGHPALRAPQLELRRNRGSQPLLWGFGVSGDFPIVLATINSEDGLSTLRALLAAHRFWRLRGLTVDLVILDEHAPSYLQGLGEQISTAVHAVNSAETLDRTGGVFVRRRDLLIADAERMLRATARLHVQCDGRELERILASTISAVAPTLAELRAPETTMPPPRERMQTPRSVGTIDGLVRPYANGIGELTANGDYELQVRGDRLPPAPWSNVIANPHGGFMITERGGGFMWAENSYFLRLTPWHNDPVSDPVSDVVYLHDEVSGDTWCATPAPIRTATTYTVRHCPGQSTFDHVRHGIAVHYALGMVEGEATRLGLLRLSNTSAKPRRIVVTTYVEWVLGSLRENTQHQVRTWFDRERGALLAQNTFDPHFAEWTSFHSISEQVTEFGGSRRTFLGRNGSTSQPVEMGAGASLSGITGVGIDPCAALRCVIELAPGETRSVSVVLGAAATEADARDTLDRYATIGAAERSQTESVNAWEERLGVVTVETPEPSFDVMVNRWSLYQALSCRMWGRSALYQSSGAYGFRDQLQDVMAFVHMDASVARAHILRAAARQFIEGDVQHWWHPHSGRGVRTRFSDDLVWLPYVVEHYVRTSGDQSVLNEYVPYLSMRTLDPHEHEIYDLPLVTDEHGTVYEHCLRALRRACTAGVHGLPLIGGGDWNDGMNRVGVDGRGESVWLAWFLIATLRSFASIAEAREDSAVAAELREHADAYVVAAERHGWDGAWYRRAFFDDGTPLGSNSSDECRIDSIAQSWSVISGAGDPSRQQQAMRAVSEQLVRTKDGIIVLLTPPFDHTSHDPGYIKGYLPGVRENGAQYTHAALWVILATALSGDGEEAFARFQGINPLHHTRTPAEVARYRVEPYVVAADVYTAPDQLGRGGWTWYTGSASWMNRVGLEGILGLEREGDRLSIAPRAPASWPEYRITYRFGESAYHILVRNRGGAPRRTGRVEVDGTAVDGSWFALVDDGRVHTVEVWHDALG